MKIPLSYANFFILSRYRNITFEIKEHHVNFNKYTKGDSERSTICANLRASERKGLIFCSGSGFENDRRYKLTPKFNLHYIKIHSLPKIACLYCFNGLDKGSVDEGRELIFFAIEQCLSVVKKNEDITTLTSKGYDKKSFKKTQEHLEMIEKFVFFLYEALCNLYDCKGGCHVKYDS